MNEPKFVGARLHGFLARDAPVGVIVRRGPSAWYQLILWHTDTDQFEFGQWFHGTIYPQVCDLSPDGKLFLYFASKHRLKKHIYESKQAAVDTSSIYKWTIISRPPFLTALAWWPIYDDSWLGGGIFVDNDTVWLKADAKRAPEKGSVPPEFSVILSGDESSEQAIERKMAESGWSLIQEGVWKRGCYDPPQVFRKERAGSQYKLLRYDSYDYRTQKRIYGLLDSATDNEVKLGSATWLDFDQRGRIVFGREGKLFAIPRGGSFDEVAELADFNEHQIEHIVAPEWALSWDGIKR
ncbi:MAG: hypothetical protein ABIQ44_03470 [Chloroflexia bacterium]